MKISVALIASGLARFETYLSKPIYAAQVAIYQAYLELHDYPAIFTAINVDTMEIYTELVPFDGGIVPVRPSVMLVRIVSGSPPYSQSPSRRLGKPFAPPVSQTGNTSAKRAGTRT